jgi:hypothetical protein
MAHSAATSPSHTRVSPNLIAHSLRTKRPLYTLYMCSKKPYDDKSTDIAGTASYVSASACHRTGDLRLGRDSTATY